MAPITTMEQQMTENESNSTISEIETNEPPQPIPSTYGSASCYEIGHKVRN